MTEDPSQFLLVQDGERDTTDERAPRLCDQCGARADWVLADRTGAALGYICVPCHDAHRAWRNHWHRRVTRQLRHAVRRS